MGGISYSGVSGNKSEPSWGDDDYWIVKTDSLANIQWDKRFGGSDREDHLGSAIQSSDGGYLLAGMSRSPISGNKTEANLGLTQVWVVKTDSTGNFKWDKTVFTDADDDLGFAVLTNNGCYVIATSTESGIAGYKTQPTWGSSADYWMIKFCDTTFVQLPPETQLSSSDSALCQFACVDYFDQSLNAPASWQWFFNGGTPDTSSLQNPSQVCYGTTGAYDVTLITTNQYGTDTLTLSNYITVYPAPDVPAITQDGNTLTSTPADFYQWQFNTVDIPGATNQTYTVTQSGFYTLVVTDTNGCFATATVYVEITGVENLPSDADFSVYPNPNSGSFNLQFNKLYLAEISVHIKNIWGEEIYRNTFGNLSGKSPQITLEDFSNGIYSIEVKMDDCNIRKKMIVVVE